MTAMRMLSAITPLGALSVPVMLALKEMESLTAQVRQSYPLKIIVGGLNTEIHVVPKCDQNIGMRCYHRQARMQLRDHPSLLQEATDI